MVCFWVLQKGLGLLFLLRSNDIIKIAYIEAYEILVELYIIMILLVILVPFVAQGFLPFYEEDFI